MPEDSQSTRSSYPSTSKSEIETRIVKSKGYTLHNLLGEGSYAKVYSAEYRDPKGRKSSESDGVQRLACKVINCRVAPVEVVVKFLPRELQIMTKLDHKHIIRTHSILYMPNVEKYFIFMQLGDNGDLFKFITEFGALREKRAQNLFRQLLSALEYLQSKKIAHRDIKCENILLTKAYNIKLTDFGFARFIDSDSDTNDLIRSSTFCGSLQYSAPEVIRGEPYDPFKIDIWSSGIFLYVALNQALPFEEQTRKALYVAQMKKQWKWRTAVFPDLSDALKQFLPRLLQPYSERRADVHELLASTWIKNDVVSKPSVVHNTTSVMTLKALPSIGKKFTPISSKIVKAGPSSTHIDSIEDNGIPTVHNKPPSNHSNS